MTTPMMQQYEAAKASCGDALLFFRMGDFYELFFEDAKVASAVLGLTLTSRDKTENPVPMAGFPHHQLDNYLAKLIRAGHRVAVCEQVENPATAKGLVKREITQIVSPGTVTDQAILDPAISNYLCAIFRSGELDTSSTKPAPAIKSAVLHPNEPPAIPAAKAAFNTDAVFGLAWIELSTGQFAAATVDQRQLLDLLERLAPSEVLLAESQRGLGQQLQLPIASTTRPDWNFGPKRARETLQKKFAVAAMEGFGFEPEDELGLRAAAAILDYLQETQAGSLEHLIRLAPFRSHHHVEVDQATWRSLEITRTIRNQERQGSLFGVIDRCVTPMGSRLLGQWLAAPLRDRNALNLRLDAVAELHQDSRLRDSLRDRLKKILDLERLIAKVVTSRCSPRDLKQIGNSLALIPAVQQVLGSAVAERTRHLATKLDPCDELRDQLERSLAEDCPVLASAGGFIRSGFHPRLDELRDLAAGGKQWIATYQQQIIAETGIHSLKVGFNKVFGYYIEVTNVHQTKVPENFIRKQTLKNVERYITPELKEYEERVLNADEQALALEQELFVQLKDAARHFAGRLKGTAEVLAELDVYGGFAQLAAQQKYCRPELLESRAVEIIDGRHPVIDVLQPLGAFVPNSTRFSDEDGWIHLITGPNMAGKSTYIRQVALITLLAQIGSFVPAKSARLGLVDRIFARVGASDELSRGQSTFMVEMTETARILNTATADSLVILDEIGRGTSTYDGVSLAWAIVEYLHEQQGCRTLFATHYHELTELENVLGGLKNYNVVVREWEERIVFLHKIARGAADKSYGIHVAQLAGVPGWVNRRAQQILDNLQSSQGDTHRKQVSEAGTRKASGQIQLTLFEVTQHPLIEKIKRIDTDHLTPLRALEAITSWQRELAGEEVEESAASRKPR
ncbi:MAG: DNA mismatch repair protein MutS [Planctomycetota bacterium]